MQSSTAEKLDFEFQEDETAQNMAPEQQSTVQSAPVEESMPAPEPARPTIQTIEVDAKDSMSLYVMPSQNYQVQEQQLPLVPTMMRDVMKHLGVFILIAMVVGLSMFKVYQVQQTRTLTATLNEILTDNDNLQKEWLSLLAQRQDLSAHTKIRAQAKHDLQMIKPKTAQEILITLD
ncbi:MAG: cell division protein FtsL [Succinivibrio sp.]|nr:cell division protein FtsL [Succinivibrio sp.]